MHVTDRQVRKLLMEYQKSGEVGMAALKAGMHRETAGKYLSGGLLPSQQRMGRDWLTRPNPFEGHWAEVAAMLADAPELEGKALFEWMCEQYPGVYHDGQVRTFQRHVRRWRALYGPAKEVYFQQQHVQGVRMETDFTCMNALAITIGGEPFDHLLCHDVLTYSNWEWATICHSESLLALRNGLQAALVQLGHVPEQHWTDHSTAATHELGGDERGRRGFNVGYLKIMDHFGIAPHTINRRQPHENGDVEAANGALKRRIKQHLLLRGSRDFEDRQAYRLFVESVLHKANTRRRKRLLEELNAMKVLNVALLPDYIEEKTSVTRWSTIQTDRRIYSVPSRLIGETVRVQRYENSVEVLLAGQHQLSMPRLTGERTHSINYRHIVEWLLRKPGAFGHYRFRADLFPSLRFRRAYDRLCEVCTPRTADIEYLRILRQAARTMQSDVERVLGELEQRGIVPRWAVLMEFWPTPETARLPDMEPMCVRLSDYDQLLSAKEVN
jgi:hypothetical protein